MAQTLTVLGVRQINHTLNRLDIYWKASATATFPEMIIGQNEKPRIDGKIICVDTWPGSTAPQNDYDPVLKNAEGVDIMGGTLANRSSTGVQRAWPSDGAATVEAPVEACLSLTITGNNVNDADGYMAIYYEGEEAS